MFVPWYAAEAVTSVDGQADEPVGVGYRSGGGVSDLALAMPRRTVEIDASIDPGRNLGLALG